MYGNNFQEVLVNFGNEYGSILNFILEESNAAVGGTSHG